MVSRSRLHAISLVSETLYLSKYILAELISTLAIPDAFIKMKNILKCKHVLC